jgi:ribosomal protein S11
MLIKTVKKKPVKRTNFATLTSPVTVWKSRVSHYLVKVHRTHNNVFYTLSSRLTNRVFSQTTAGHLGIKGSKRDTPVSAEQAAKRFAANAYYKFGVRIAHLHVSGRLDQSVRAALRGFERLRFLSINVNRPIAHNGVRSASERRC